MLSERVQAGEGEGGGGGGIKAKLAARFKKRSEDSPEKKKQLQDYTAWVNNYLRRKPGTALVTDLRSNLSDGTTFVHLVEIVAKAQVAGIERWPGTLEGRRGNTERALEFLQGDGVILHNDACRDLMEGNVKGVMKVILAIAERYQPKSVKPRNTASSDQNKPTNHSAPVPADGRGHTPPSNTDAAHTRHDTARPFAPPLMTSAMVRSHSLSQPMPGSGYPSNPAYYRLSQPDRLTHEREGRSYSYGGGGGREGDNDVYSTPVDQLPASAAPQLILPKKKVVGVRLRSGSMAMKGIPEEAAEETVGEGLTNEIGAVVTGLTEFKAELLQLHAVLLRNSDGVSNVGGAKRDAVEIGTKEEEGEGVVRGEEGGGGGGGGRREDGRCQKDTSKDMTAPNQVSEEVVAEVSMLREQVAQLQDECTQVEAECSALRNMVEERNAFITTMKSEIYRKEYLNDTEKMDLHQQLLQKDTIMKKLEADLTSCHGILEERQSEVQGLRQQVGQQLEQEQRTRAELESLRAELGKLTSSEETLQSKLATRERKIGQLEDRLADAVESKSRRSEQLSEDLESIREGLAQLAADSAQPILLETLQKTMADLATKLAEKPPSPPGRRRRHRDTEDHSREARHRRKHKDRHSSQAESHSSAPPTSLGESTRVLYHMLSDKTETPYVTMVPKKLSEVTLKDFKAVFDRPGNFRYFFKTEDPDCGVVKEEVIADDQFLPSWNGKMIAWIRETGALSTQ